jgi:hypothetical protein
MTKNEYIVKEILKIQERKESKVIFFNNMLKQYDDDIEKMKNLSDEDFAKLNEKKDESSSKLNLILNKIGLTTKDLDDVDFDDIPENFKIKMKTLSSNDQRELLNILDEED